MLAVWFLAGCGRVGFDAADVDGGSPIDSIPASAVFARYPLDDDFSATMMARDVSGNGRHMTCAATSCPVRGQARPGGPMFAALFDGTNDSLLWQPIGGEADLGNFTITAWIKPVRRPVDLEVIVARSVAMGPASSFAFDHLFTGQLSYSSGFGESLFGTSILAPATWTHVGFSYDGTVKRLYAGGVFDGATNQVGVTYDSDPLLIGAHHSGGAMGHFFEGQIEDVIIFDRVLSDAEIALLAQ